MDVQLKLVQEKEKLLDVGLHNLAGYLKKNLDQGIQYHKPDGSKGDYDELDNEYQILQLLRKK